jgi:hypothetical protein
MSLLVRPLGEGDTALIAPKGPITCLLQHKRARDGPINFLGTGVPPVNERWLTQNMIRKIVALWDVGSSSSGAEAVGALEVVGVCTVIMKKRTATVEMIKVRVASRSPFASVVYHH